MPNPDRWGREQRYGHAVDENADDATTIDLERRGDVWVLHMDNGENRFNRRSIDALHAALDEVEAADGPCALVTTGEGKFFSNGLDLDWLLAGGDGSEGFLDDVHRLFGRVLGFGAYTVAAVNGHAFAGGAMLASAHDRIVMREDRGYWCLPEVDLGLPLTPAMYATVAAHIPEATLRDAALTGRRYSGPDALAAGIAHELASEGDLLDRAVEVAAAMAGKSRAVLAEHKRLMYADAMATCGVPPAAS
ncbi:MAG: enoyl-CoA hydratase/carnithine racemase [Acidimicrobiales bacterium]|nr:enoyl-CoA hydratase/carnithine racemase [Acidimicrobiales bacterium]